MPYLPLCALEGFSKNQPQHLIWMGICRQMTSLNTKNEGSLLIIVPSRMSKKLI